MGEKETALADVVGARRALDCARAKGAVAQARLEAASGGLVSGEAGSWSVATSTGGVARLARPGYVPASVRWRQEPASGRNG